MDSFPVYKDRKARTGGELYIGVVGPVRSGKSTFIKRFMEQMVLPQMEEGPAREQARDELPQSAQGKMVMTTEPKFIPKEAANITLGEDLQVRVRLIDCVGYMVEGATGHMEENGERLVKTPWFDYEIPFTRAAEIGTEKVIRDHSTIGLVITTDGSIGELPRESYEAAESRAAEELKSIGKPFLMLLNSRHPGSSETVDLAEKLSGQYQIPVLPVNCEQLSREDVFHILEEILLEFPVVEVDFRIPKWVEILPEENTVKAGLLTMAGEILQRTERMRDARRSSTLDEVEKGEGVRFLRVERMDLSCGIVSLEIQMQPEYYYRTVSEYVGIPITGEYQMMRLLMELAAQSKEYAKVQAAVDAVRGKGYGVVYPGREEIRLEEPTLIRHGSKYGVKMKAEAASIHLIRANIRTEIAPIVGSEEQAKDLISYIQDRSGQGENAIWDTNIFGKSIEQIVDSGIQNKISQMTEDCQQKLQDTMQKIVNDSNGGIICIIL